MDTWAASIILVVVDNNAMKIGVLMFLLVFQVSLGIFPEVGLLGQMADPFLIF